MAGVKVPLLRLKYTMQEHHLKVSPIIQSAVFNRSTRKKTAISHKIYQFAVLGMLYEIVIIFAYSHLASVFKEKAFNLR